MLLALESNDDVGIITCNAWMNPKEWRWDGKGHSRSLDAKLQHRLELETFS